MWACPAIALGYWTVIHLSSLCLVYADNIVRLSCIPTEERRRRARGAAGESEETGIQHDMNTARGPRVRECASRWLERRVRGRWRARGEMRTPRVRRSGPQRVQRGEHAGLVPPNRELSPWLPPVARAMIVSSTRSLTTEPAHLPMPLTARTSTSDGSSPPGDGPTESEGERGTGRGQERRTRRLIRPRRTTRAHFLPGVKNQ